MMVSNPWKKGLISLEWVGIARVSTLPKLGLVDTQKFLKKLTRSRIWKFQACIPGESCRECYTPRIMMFVSTSKKGLCQEQEQEQQQQQQQQQQPQRKRQRQQQEHLTLPHLLSTACQPLVMIELQAAS